MTGVVTALAGALATMCGRFADGEPADVAARAEDLQIRAASLAEADLVVYAAYVQARREKLGTAKVAAALDEATRVPLELAEIAAELAQIAAELARSGNPRLRGDAMAGLLMAAAATRAAAILVCENLGGATVGDEPRLALAATLVASVDAAELASLSVYPALTRRPSADTPMNWPGRTPTIGNPAAQRAERSAEHERRAHDYDAEPHR